MRGIGRLRRLAGRPAGRELPRELIEMTPEDRRYLDNLYDASVPLPEGAAEYLSETNPMLRELRDSYAALDLPVLSPSRWDEHAVRDFLDLAWFRGETLFYWHYRELPRITELKYFVWLRYVEQRDERGLLERLEEDGSFGCWTFSYRDRGVVSRDLLESVNELLFLDRELDLAMRESISVLDIGAGYGRLAHRAVQAFPSVRDYCCVDAVAESTFLSDYYLRWRGVAPPARVVRLDRVEQDLEPGSFELAVNIHSWSECTLQAIEWWVAQLERLAVPKLLVIPNEPTELLSLEGDGRRVDFLPLLNRAGYHLVKREAVVRDGAVRELLRLDDHFHVFERR